MRAMILSVTMVLLGCGSSATGSTCPTSNPPTYANFGRAFFATYCDRCHTVSTRPSLRTQAEIQAQRTAIDLAAASGPSNTNTTMPEGSPTPTAAERTRLGEWLACGAP